MKTKLKKQVITLLIFLSFFSINIFAQNSETTKHKTHFSIEIDPVTFALNGYAFHLRISPDNSQHYLFGIGTYAMDMPDEIININSNNKNKGWNVRLNQGYGLFGEYHFQQVNKKWFIGSQISLQEYKIENEQTEGNEKFQNILLMSYGGYTWQPFEFGLYIKPWAGIGYTTKISGNNNLGNFKYDISPITMFATLHIGYTF